MMFLQTLSYTDSDLTDLMFPTFNPLKPSSRSLPWYYVCTSAIV